MGGYFGEIREDYWLDLQKHYELDCWKEKQRIKEIVKQVQPYANISNKSSLSPFFTPFTFLKFLK